MHRRDLLRFSVAASTFLAGASLVGCALKRRARGFRRCATMTCHCCVR